MSYEVTILLVAAKQLYEGLSDLIFRFGAEKADFFTTKPLFSVDVTLPRGTCVFETRCHAEKN
jgi:hypothetical protein